MKMKDKKKCYFVSNYVDNKDYENIYTKEKKPGIQIQKFDRLIVEGLIENDVDVICYTSIPASSVVLGNTFLKVKNHDRFKYSFCINIPIIKDIYVLIAVLFRLLFSSFDFCILDPLSPANTLAASLVCKIRRKPCMAIITDLPEFMTSNQLYQNITNLVISNSSYYTFLSDKMNERLNKKNKPYVIVEGFSDYFDDNTYEHNNEIIYAGNLSIDNGVMNLVNAFQKSKLHDTCILRLFGGGSAVKHIEALNDARIHYEGTKPNTEVLFALRRAMLLVNPRPTSEEFTKYSFPSKTIESLGTGTPFASTELYAIGKEYFNYVDSLKDGSEEEILSYLNHFNDIEYNARLDKASKGKEFVTSKKSKKEQTRKMIQLFGE